MRPLTAVLLHWSELISVGVLISLTQTQPKHHTLARRRGRTIQNSSVLLTLCLGDTILSLPGRVCLIKHLFIYLFAFDLQMFSLGPFEKRLDEQGTLSW